MTRCSASRPVRTENCISAMRCRPSSITTWRVRRMAGFCSASRISTRCAAGRNLKRRSSRTCAGWGFNWEEPVRRQSEHVDVYRDALEKLRGMGLVYPAFLSRAEVKRRVAEAEEQGDDGRAIPTARRFIRPRSESSNRRSPRRASKPGNGISGGSIWTGSRASGIGEAGLARDRARCARTHPGQSCSLGRCGALALGRAVELSSLGGGGRCAAGVTHVVRGRDLYWSTPVHRLLQRLLDLPQPTYLHHRLLPRRRRSETVEKPAIDRAQGVAGGGRHTLRYRRRIGL